MENQIEVYKAISRIQGELAKTGISKDQTNKMQGFKYRGIDDVYSALAPILAECKLCILPRMINKEVVERASKAGGALFYTTILAEFDLISALDGSKHTVSSYGEALDSGDKSVGKAMSYAFKAMAFMTFSIPTDGENDPDSQSHEVVATTSPRAVKPATESAGLNSKICNDCNKPFVPKAGTESWSKTCYPCYQASKKMPISPPKEAPSDEISIEDLPF